MIKEINTPDGPKSMLLGYETLKQLVKLQKEGKDEFELMESVALFGFNVFEKRKEQDQTTKEQMVDWFDDPEIFLQVQDAITEFSENFTKKESQKA